MYNNIKPVKTNKICDNYHNQEVQYVYIHLKTSSICVAADTGAYRRYIVILWRYGNHH